MISAVEARNMVGEITVPEWVDKELDRAVVQATTRNERMVVFQIPYFHETVDEFTNYLRDNKYEVMMYFLQHGYNADVVPVDRMSCGLQVTW